MYCYCNFKYFYDFLVVRIRVHILKGVVVASSAYWPIKNLIR